MSEPTGGAQTALLLRLSVPAEGGLRSVAPDLAGRVAAFAGTSGRDAKSIVADLEPLLQRVAPKGTDADIALEFRTSAQELVVHARCEGQVSELRYPLPE